MFNRQPSSRFLGHFTWAALFCTVAALPVRAADAASDAAAAATNSTSVDAVIVTGVRGGVGRTVITSPAPIDVIGGPELTQTGKVGLKEVLNTLVPSFDLPGINGGGTSWTVRAFTLRGLNGDQALFLVNGTPPLPTAARLLISAVLWRRLPLTRKRA